MAVSPVPDLLGRAVGLTQAEEHALAIACNQPCGSVCESQQPVGQGCQERRSRTEGGSRNCGVDWMWPRSGAGGEEALEAGVRSYPRG